MAQKLNDKDHDITPQAQEKIESQQPPMQEHQVSMPTPVEHLMRFNADSGIEVTLVTAHVLGFSIRPPEDAGDLWHQEPVDKRQVEIIIHSLGVNSGFRMPLKDAIATGERISNTLREWHQYALTAPRPMMIGGQTPMGAGLIVPGGPAMMRGN